MVFRCDKYSTTNVQVVNTEVHPIQLQQVTEPAAIVITNLLIETKRFMLQNSLELWNHGIEKYYITVFMKKEKSKR